MKTSHHKASTTSRDLRLAYRLWLLTRADFAWQALAEMLWEDASTQLRKNIQLGLYKQTTLDTFKRQKLTFLLAYELLQELDRDL